MPEEKKTPPVPAAKIAVENVNVPGCTHLVDAAMYAAVRKALGKALPAQAPGLMQSGRCSRPLFDSHFCTAAPESADAY